MEERKIRGRSRRRKYKNQMRRPIAVLLALMLSFSSFGTACRGGLENGKSAGEDGVREMDRKDDFRQRKTDGWCFGYKGCFCKCS